MIVGVASVVLIAARWRCSAGSRTTSPRRSEVGSAIEIRGVSKRFRINKDRPQSSRSG